MRFISRNLRNKGMTFPQKRKIEAFQGKLVEWFDNHGRRFTWRDPKANLYTKVVSEVLLQRTRAETVEKFFPDFLERFPSWESLAAAEEVELQDWLKPIGLWQRRAASMKKLSTAIVEKGLPSNREDIDALPGVGQYIGNAIELFSCGKARPLLDVNMARLLERYFGPRKLADIRYDPYLQKLSAKVSDTSNPTAINWAILDFASLVCKIRPECKACPIRRGCFHFNVQNN